MSRFETRRPLEDMIGELVEGLVMPNAAGLRATSVEFTLPVETRVVGGPGGLVVHADMPATRTRTDFDLPLGRLTMRLATLATGEAP